MFALARKPWNTSLWSRFARVLRRAHDTQAVDIDRLSAHMLRDVGVPPQDARDLLAAERFRFLS
ncbi:hypothetical protein [Dongia rigui]|uniref:DUF1127 domain-containing protein n=1 Tax=Dongia rigui TaxID=940149 RepID=A0ABU5DU97_9PROT|nr:hypothetical protein [Dongia rigui]MDY0870885.1 hypothetical protein [Dongia rigui]